MNADPVADSHPISRWWLALPLGFLILAIVVLQPNPADPLRQSGPAVGKPAPVLDLVRLSDESVSEFASELDPAVPDRLRKVAPGKVTLIHFWATWCGPCMMEYPHLSAMANRLKSNPRFDFLPVSCEGGRDETPETLGKKTFAYFHSEGIDSVAFADLHRLTRRSTAERLERDPMCFPTSLVIGSDGRIAGVWEGYTPQAVPQMESLIDRLLLSSAVTR